MYHDSLTNVLTQSGELVQHRAGPIAYKLKKGCPVENTRPKLLVLNPDQGGPNAGIKPGLQQAAREAFLQSKANPQLVIVILPVDLGLPPSENAFLMMSKRKDTIMYSEIKRIAAEGLLKVC